MGTKWQKALKNLATGSKIFHSFLLTFCSMEGVHSKYVSDMNRVSII